MAARPPAEVSARQQRARVRQLALVGEGGRQLVRTR
jgi:hypothetical protein